MADKGRICVGMITAAHGVRGLVRIKPFTADPAAVTAYGPVGDEAGRRQFALTLLNRHKDQWLARIDGIDDRNAAEALRGTGLFVDRAALPPPEDDDEFYHADLIGLAAVSPDGRRLGRVRAVHDFGAGDLLELVTEAGGIVTVPFTRAAVPEIDIAAGRVVVVPLEEGAETETETEAETAAESAA